MDKLGTNEYLFKGFGYLATSPEYAFPYCGTIKRWDAKFMNKGTLWLQVWRHHKVMNYRLVQETPVYVTKGEREREREFVLTEH